MASQQSQDGRTRNMLRLSIFVGCLGWFVPKVMHPILFPFGSAVPVVGDDRISYVSVDHTNDSLQSKHGKLTKIYERKEGGKRPLLVGPETVVFDHVGNLFLLTEEANLVQVSDMQPSGNENTMTATTTLVASLGQGRPLGGCFTPDNTLYIADAVLGLTRMRNPAGLHSKIELVAAEVMDGDAMTTIRFADDVTVGPQSGMVYFTDATDIPASRDNSMVWDVMYPSKANCMQGTRTGRLLQYNPETEDVTVLARNLLFANGIAVDEQETYILFAETFSLRLAKYHLAGDKKGSLEYVVDGPPAPGYYDGVDCAWTSKGNDNEYCYGIHPSTVVPAHKVLNAIPHPLDQILRSMLMLLPSWLAPAMQPYTAISVVDASRNEFVELLQDPTGKDVAGMTGVTVRDNKLYLGSLRNDYIGVYEL
mmetsp:Transcript_705/g.1997  ORF Transcript_705/g.1997 Transcript_705/m.1997 type:complete len:422 (-) Transcript_705:293-1558(-)|eukprot:CAMPEP_0198108932 /NCGR_PEP_ID=MMETSP1442-20131203/965_1 /TAXON_ID= /ORGANISM="Craspedostauros australis, Strain CCMP3328" /LENGTH=421 /DNA_ID=CAMNT_0043764355 /DNA_START=67 /DNA_END=1332 /DNA_ORIENTATION=-